MRSPFPSIRLLATASLFAAIPVHAATFTVTRADDPAGGVCTAGDCSLRAAIVAANTAAGADTIAFNVPPGAGGIVTIVPGAVLPPLSGDDTTINGYSQPGAVAPTNNPNVFNGTIRVVLDGRTLAGANAKGLEISGNRNTVRGLAILGFANAQVEITGSNNVVSGNRIGTDAAGVFAIGLPSHGVVLRRTGAAPIANRIGTEPERNLISGVRVGVLADGIGDGQNLDEENRISNNFINIAANGEDYTFGGDGVVLRNCNNVRVGASNNTPFASGNKIGGSPLANHVAIDVDGGVRQFVQGNFIGGAGTFQPSLFPAGTGILVRNGATFTFVQDNQIFATIGSGIVVLDGTVPGATRATITTNSVLSPGGMPIDLGGDGPDANDALDADSGPNLRQNAPTITSVTVDGVYYRVAIAHTGEPNTNYSFDLFATRPPGAGGSSSGAKNANFLAFFMQWMFATFNVIPTTDANGQTTAIGTILRQLLPEGAEIAATATKNVFSGTPTTSELGAATNTPVTPAGDQLSLQISHYDHPNIADARAGRVVYVRRTGDLTGTASATVVAIGSATITPPPGGNLNPTWADGDGSLRPYVVTFTGATPPQGQFATFGLQLQNPVGATLGLPSIYKATITDYVYLNAIPELDVVFTESFETRPIR